MRGRHRRQERRVPRRAAHAGRAVRVPGKPPTRRCGRAARRGWKEDPLLRKRFFAPSRRDPDARFTIAHYAGDVEYDVSGFLAKNKDEVPESALELLETSKEPFAVALARRRWTPSGYDAGTKKKTSVGARFKTQLAELVARLDACAPRFIRCVKPNETRAPDAFHDDVVLAQMRCCGVLEVCRIARLGYPTRWPFAAFVARSAASATPSLFASRTTRRRRRRRAAPSSSSTACAPTNTSSGSPRCSCARGRSGAWRTRARRDGGGDGAAVPAARRRGVRFSTCDAPRRRRRRSGEARSRVLRLNASVPFA